jgi:cardiolipin synthase
VKRRQHFRGKKRWVSTRSAAHSHSTHQINEQSLAPEDRSFLKELSTITQLPLATVSKLELLHKAPAFYHALLHDIAQAKHSILVQSYVWRDDEVGKMFLEALMAASRRGVAVRLLIDELGSLRLPGNYFEPLIEAGGEFSWCYTLSPIKSRYWFNLRNHRKLQIIDSHAAYVGGMNFGREYMGREPSYGDWSDTQIRIEGKVVEICEELFAEDWFFATGREHMPEPPPSGEARPGQILTQVLRGGPDEEDHPMLRVNLALAGQARKRLWIATGYFVPGETMQAALQVAAARGVDVRLLVSERSEHPYLVKAGRSYYEALLRQGVRIYEYDRGIEHSKYVIIDDHWTSVGSSNFDERSMRLNFELSLLTYHKKTNTELAHIFQDTIAQAHEIDLKTFSQRPYSEKLLESALRPLSPVL